MSTPLKCLQTSSRNHFQLPSLKNLRILSSVDQQIEYTTLVDHEEVKEPLFNRYKTVTVLVIP